MSRLQTSTKCRGVRKPLYAPTFGWPATIVRYGCNVLDMHNVQSNRRQRADRRLASGARTFDAHLDGLDAVLVTRNSRSCHRSLLGSVRCTFARTLEPN